RAVAMLLCAAGLARAADDPRTPPAFRLGDDVAPVRYGARLAIDPAQAEFTGEVRIDLAFVRATPMLWLHAVNLTVESARFTQGERTFEAKPVVAPGPKPSLAGFEAPGEPSSAGPSRVTISSRGTRDP